MLQSESMNKEAENAVNLAAAEEKVPMHKSNLTMYVVIWVFLTPIALICCMCNGCDHFEGGQ